MVWISFLEFRGMNKSSLATPLLLGLGFSVAAELRLLCHFSCRTQCEIGTRKGAGHAKMACVRVPRKTRGNNAQSLIEQRRVCYAC